MALAAFNQPEISDLIEEYSDSADLTLIVGAGASVEATLPTWDTLLRRLLERAAANVAAIGTDDEREAWIAETLRKDSYLGAGAAVEALSAGQLQNWLPQALFGSGGASSYEPGAIARQVAYLRDVWGARLAILTTNYDDLLERALQVTGVAPLKDIKSYVRRRTPPAGAVVVLHLHGFAGRDGTSGTLILSEEHYHRMQRGRSWQEEEMVDRLEHTDCLFIGTSLNDPNLIRYLYGYKQHASRNRAAVFIRQEDELEPAVRAAREQTTVARWQKCGVKAVFLDHYCDAAQLLHEMGLRRQARTGGGAYQPVLDRARVWLDRVETETVALHGTVEHFHARQDWLSDRLHSILSRAIQEAEALGAQLGHDERVQLVLWLANNDGTELTGWGHSDRAHRDPRTIEGVPVDAESNWVAVRAFCQGSRFERDRDVYASRWKFVRGLPLVLTGPDRVQVGCLSVASNLTKAHSILGTMDANVRGVFNRFIVDQVLELLQPGAAPALA